MTRLPVAAQPALCTVPNISNNNIYVLTNNKINWHTVEMEGFKSLTIRRISAAFLQGVIVLIGFAALGFLLWEPHLEGRNAKATVFEVYFHDPFLAYVYIASIPFFLGLYHGFKVLGHAGKSQVFSATAVNSLRMIKRCSIAMIGLVAVGEIFILMNSSDDCAGGVFMGGMLAFCSIIIATTSAMFEHILQNAVDLKSENELTV